MGFRRPVEIGEHHRVDGFSCGVPELDRWLRDRALYNHHQGYTRTIVIATQDYAVAGYYALCAGMIQRNDLTRSVRGNMAPDNIPVALLARLAVDEGHHGCGLGEALLCDALRAVTAASRTVAFRAIMVDAISDRAAAFYRKFGFRASRISPSRLLLPMADVMASLEAAINNPEP